MFTRGEIIINRSDNTYADREAYDYTYFKSEMYMLILRAYHELETEMFENKTYYISSFHIIFYMKS